MDVEVDGILVAAHELKAPLAVLRQLAFSISEMNSRDEHIRSEMISVSERAIKQERFGKNQTTRRGDV